MAEQQAMTLTFLGAARTVTGSKYLVTWGDRRLMVDAGLFQGEKALRLQNWADFPIDPATISHIALTHAHLDHCGYLPVLVRHGFRGTIWSTEGTRRLAEIVLRDAGMLQEMDAQHAAEFGYSKHKPPLPLFSAADVETTLPLFRSVPYDTDVDLGDGFALRLTRAGHILGAASVTVRMAESSVLFSGDIGRANHPVLRARETPPGSPFVVVESTYGDREHPEPPGPAHEEFADAIRRTIDRGGSVLVPAYAVDRTEVVLQGLTQMVHAGRIPNVPIYVDSPMALAALRLYESAEFRSELSRDLGGVPFVNLPRLREVTSIQESMRLNRPSEPSIIISASGMAVGGRVLHHLEHMLPDKRNTVVLVGYQAAGTRGRDLLEGAHKIKMHGRYIRVRAEILFEEEFSVHADASDVITWLRELQPAPLTIFVTHGEEQSAQALAARIEQELDINAVIPTPGEIVQVRRPKAHTTPADG